MLVEAIVVLALLAGGLGIGLIKAFNRIKVLEERADLFDQWADFIDEAMQDAGDMFELILEEEKK